MICVPKKRIKKIAKRDGLNRRLNIIQKPSLTNGYNPVTGEIHLRPYDCPARCAQRLCHEIKHRIDLQDWPSWLVLAVYWPVITAAALGCGWLFGWWWAIPGFVGAYFLHPFEISANWYALRNWKKYHRAIVEHNNRIQNAQKP